jgi:serine/threonine-protein kinase
VEGSGGAAAPGQIGRYRLVGEIGRGAMGRVYVAHDPNVERRVALKVMSAPAGIDDEEVQELRRRLLLEARAAGRLSHPGIVAVHDADTAAETGLSFLAMELIEGESLEHWLRRAGFLPPALAVDLVAQIARALGYAHRRGVVHRDVKPANILITEDGKAKVADFGIAKVGSLAVTRAGLVIGSPYFMSPEQVLGHAVDGRSDLFSLGGVLYRCLSGELPFPGEGVVTVAFKVVQVDPRPLDAERLGLTPALVAVVERALAKKPEDRFATGEEMAEALERAAAGLEGSAALPVPVEPRPIGPVQPFSDREQTQMLERATNAFAVPSLPAPAASRTQRVAATARTLAAGLALAGLVALAALLAGNRAGEAPGRLPVMAAPAYDAPARASTVRPALAASPEAASEPGSLPDRAPAPSRPAEPAVTERVGGAPVVPAAVLTASSAPAAESALELVYRNRLGSATVAVTVDGVEVWNRPVAAPPNWSRIVGDEVLATIPVAAGDHRISVAITGHSMTVQARSWIVGRFEPGRSRRLRVSLNPYTDKAWLEWL